VAELDPDGIVADDHGGDDGAGMGEPGSDYVALIHGRDAVGPAPAHKPVPPTDVRPIVVRPWGGP
jgi:hypothetical protein